MMDLESSVKWVNTHDDVEDIWTYSYDGKAIGKNTWQSSCTLYFNKSHKNYRKLNH